MSLDREDVGVISVIIIVISVIVTMIFFSIKQSNETDQKNNNIKSKCKATSSYIVRDGRKPAVIYDCSGIKNSKKP